MSDYIPDVRENISVEKFSKEEKDGFPQSQILLEALHPSYFINVDEIDEHVEKSSLELLDGFTYFRIVSCSIDNPDDEFEYLNLKMQKLFSALHTLEVTISYGVISYQGKSNLVIGIRNIDNVNVMTNIISGLLSGVELEEYFPKFMEKEDETKFHGVFPGIPSCIIDDEPQTFDISPLMRSLNGQDYTLLIIAKPISIERVEQKNEKLMTISDKLFAISKKTVEQQRSAGETKSESSGVSESVGTFSATSQNRSVSAKVASIGLSRSNGKNSTKSSSKEKSTSTTVSASEAISIELQNSDAIKWKEYADYAIERFDRGISSGMWQTAITYSSNSEIARNVIQGLLNAEISKPNPQLLPARHLLVDDHMNEPLLIPKSLIDDKNADNPLCMFLTTSEIGFLCTLPVDRVPDFELKHNKQYPMISSEVIQGGVELGKLSDNGRISENMSFRLNEADLNKHTFVCGITGSGKTTTIKGVLANCDKPFLVIESAKKEYRHLKPKNNKKTLVYTLGKPEINCLQMNPFYIMVGVSPQTHIDFLKDLFNASFSFYGPMPYILEKCLQNIYINRGWNLTLGYHPYFVNKDNSSDFFDFHDMQKKYSVNSHKFLFPTMYELKCEIERYIKREMEYDGEVAGNIKTAILTRLESLCNGAKGFMFNTNQYADMEQLLNNDVVFELEGLADDSDKAFCVGMLVIFINEYRQVEKESQGNQKCSLKHLLVIEEAHRLLKNIETERNSENMGTPKGKAVEHFTNMIAEMRSYGQGVIIAEQIPRKLAPDVIKNTSNKIVQRIVSYDDQEIIANTIGIAKEESIFLGTLKTGFALCHKEGMDKPVHVRINQVEDVFVSDSNLYIKDLQDRMYLINSSIVGEAISLETEKHAFKLLNTLLICDPSCGVSSIEKVQELFSDVLCKKGVELVLFSDLNKIIADELTIAIMKYLMIGVYSAGKLISDDISKKLFDMIRTPTEKRVGEFKEIVSKLHSRNSKNLGLLVVSEMFKNQYSKDVDIRKSIQNFFIQYDPKDIEEAVSQIYGGERNVYCGSSQSIRSGIEH